MSDSTSVLDLIESGQLNPDVTANQLFDQMAHAALFALRLTATSGLTWGYQGGRMDGTAVASGTVTLTASNDNYIVAHRTTLVVSISTATTNWNDTTTYGRCYKVVAGTGSATSWEDHRFGTGGILTPVVSVGSIADDSVTNAKLANMATARIKGRTTAGTGDPEDLTGTQTTALLDNVVGDSGSGGTKGLVPAPASGDAAANKFLKASGAWATLPASTVTESIILACSDEVTALSAGTGKITFRMPYAFTVTGVRASLTTAQASGSIFTIDINDGGTTILSTKITIDNTEKTSTTAVTAAVISDSALADDAEVSVDIDQIGDGTAKGLKVVLIGNQ
jgi:hypothetical protein